MNYVQLCDMVRREGGIAGAEITTISGNIPLETRRIRNWVRDAWNDIQTLQQRWFFLYNESSHLVPQYANVIQPNEFAAGVVAEWIPSSLRLSKADEPRSKSQPICVQNYAVFKDEEGLDPTKRGRPSVVAIHPRTEAIHLAPAADQEYTFYFDYYRTPQVLDAEVEEPIMPARFHALIAWEALIRYGGYEVAPDVIARAQNHSNRLMTALMQDQMSMIDLVTLEDSVPYGY